MTYPVRNTKINLQKRQSTERVMKLEVNILVMMTALHCGTGNVDISKMGAFLGITRTKSWEWSASTHTTQVNNQITSVVNTVVEESLKKEITTTTNVVLSEEKYSKRKIEKKQERYIFDKDVDNIPSIIKTITTYC